LLEHELHHGVGQSGVCLARLGVGHDVVIAGLGQGEPGGEFVGPGDDLAVPGLKPGVVGRPPGRLGLLALAQVVVQAAEQQRQSSGGDQQLAMLAEGAPPADQPGM
jgi:hypothetical protein